MKTKSIKEGRGSELWKRAAETMRVLAHPERLRLLYVLRKVKTAAVGRLVEEMELPQAVTSHHLGLLRRAGLIEAERRGQEVWYRVADERCYTILDCIEENGSRS
jgi:ArsR family transcriptional regulator, zinc-responsive transcriptional repressor